MNYETLVVAAQDGVVEITLNRPDQLNAINAKAREELMHLFLAARDDASLRVLLITGAGRAFSAGADLKDGSVTEPPIESVESRWWGDFRATLATLGKPSIAAVNGMALGGAFYILGEVEFIIASETATFFDPHVTHGMPCVYEPMLMLQRMPIGEIMRLSLLGRFERMSAKRAYEIGLVQEVTAPDKLLEAARWSAEVIAAAPDSQAIESTVKAIWTAQYMSIHQALQNAPALVNVCGTDVPARANELRQQRIESRTR